MTVCRVRCPAGRRLVRYDDGSGTLTCDPINECVELRDPCHGGHCVDADDGYVCECAVGRGGPTCAEYRESRLAHVDITFAALAVIVACLILLLCKCSLINGLFLLHCNEALIYIQLYSPKIMV